MKPGDGVVFDAAYWRSPQQTEEGGRIYSVTPALNGDLEIAFANNAIDTSRIRPGDLLWRTHNPDSERAARPYLSSVVPVRKQTVNVHAVARAGRPLLLRWTLECPPQASISVSSPDVLAAAKSQQSSVRDRLKAQLERLGNTPYTLGTLTVNTDEQALLPASLLNQLRREAVGALQQFQAHPHPQHVQAPAASLKRLLPHPLPLRCVTPADIALHLLVRTPAQLDAALALHPASITLDYLDLYGLRPSLDRLRQSDIEARVASPRILKPGEARISNFLRSLDCAILARSAGLLN